MNDNEQILVTWYGTTDFRASIGFEESGPILGALRSGAYKRAVVLGFTNEDKSRGVANATREELLRDAGKAGTPAEKFAVVDRYQNTAVAHGHFKNWLEETLCKAGIRTKTDFHPIPLKALNDTDGIYEAAINALESVQQTSPNSAVSIFVSPGTPVMAFVWAFASLRFPRMKKRLVSSSNSSHQLEAISLPAEWLEWNGRKKGSGAFLPAGERFDYCFHLFGDERLPSYRGIYQLPSRTHVFVTSAKYDTSVFESCIREEKSSMRRLDIDAFNPESVRNSIVEFVEKTPANSRIAFNLTGGTKMMFQGALLACRKINATPYYFDMESNAAVNLDTFEKAPLLPIKSVDVFFKTNGKGLRMRSAGRWADLPWRKTNVDCGRLRECLWEHRDVVWPIYRGVSDLISKFGTQKVSASFKEPSGSEIPIEASWGTGGLNACFKIGIRPSPRVFDFDVFPDFARFVSGGWFEEYVYSQLELLQEEGLIHDLRISLEIDCPPEVNPRRTLRSGKDLGFNQIDVCFTDGSRLYVLECKAGGVKTEHITKLEGIVNMFGGVSGRGMLVSSLPEDQYNWAVKEHLKRAKKCVAVSGDNLAEKIKLQILADRSKYLPTSNR